MLLDQVNAFFTQIVGISVAVVIAIIIIVVLLRGIKVAKPDEAIIVTSRQRTPKAGEKTSEM